MQKNVSNIYEQKIQQELKHPIRYLQRFVVNNNNKVKNLQNGKKLSKSSKYIYQNKNIAAQKNLKEDLQNSNSKKNLEKNGKNFENFDSYLMKKNHEIEKLKMENALLREENNGLLNNYNNLYNKYVLVNNKRKCMDKDLNTCNSLIRKMAARLESLDGRNILEIMEDPEQSSNRTIVYPDDPEDQYEFESLDTQ